MAALNKKKFLDTLIRQGSESLLCRFADLDKYEIYDMNDRELRDYLSDVYDQLPEEDLKAFEEELLLEVNGK